MISFKRKLTVRLGAIALAGLMPAQAVAHCGMPLTGFHDRAHHTAGASAGPSHQPAHRLLSFGDTDACVLAEPLFTASRMGAETALYPAVAFDRQRLTATLPAGTVEVALGVASTTFPPGIPSAHLRI